jgi:preprotein translocase subunit SecD
VRNWKRNVDLVRCRPWLFTVYPVASHPLPLFRAVVHAAEEQDRIRVAIAKYEEQKKADARAKQAATLANIQQQMALKAERESADLNDPLALRKSRPAREGDFDPRLGVSSAQVFDGEDLYAAERGRMQAEQMKAWCLEAQGARLAKAQEEKAAQREYAEYLERVGKMKDDYEAAARAEAARRLEEAKAYNLRMVRVVAVVGPLLRSQWRMSGSFSCEWAMLLSVAKPR